MDILYHAVSGIAIAKSMDASSPYGAAVFAMLPDLAGIIPYFAIKFIAASKNPTGGIIRTYTGIIQTNRFVNRIDAAAYRATHSLYTVGIVAALTYVFFRDQWLVFSVCYLSHILIDIPTHDEDFATRIFFPTSDFHLQGANWVTHPKLFLFFWAVLGIIVFFLWRT